MRKEKKTECLRIPLEFPKVPLNISIAFQTQGAFCMRPVQSAVGGFCSLKPIFLISKAQTASSS